MASEDQKLFADFPPVSDETWEAAIHADLKGRDYERALVWKTYEGINVLPYYRRQEHDSTGYSESLPGEFPFVRGNKRSGNDWLIRQDIFVKDFGEANKKAFDNLNKGVNSLGFVLSCKTKITKADLELLLKDIYIEFV